MVIRYHHCCTNSYISIFINYGFECKWLSFAKSIYDYCDMLFGITKGWIVLSAEQRLKDQFKCVEQKWACNQRDFIINKNLKRN